MIVQEHFMPDYRLIAFDMDGTLLNSAKQLLPGTVSALAEAAAAGKAVALCTGRPVNELKDFFPLLPGVRYAVATSGAAIYDCATDSYPALSPLADETVLQLLAVSRHEDAMVHLLCRDGTAAARDYIDRMPEYGVGIFQPVMRRLADAPEDLEQYYLQTRPVVLKLNFYCRSAEDRARIRASLAGIHANLVDVEEAMLECSPPGVDKGKGLETLCGILGISPAEAIAVGDSGNDIEMLRTAGLGIAMGNASPEALAAADLTVADCDSGGCAEAVYRYLLGGGPLA